MVDVLTSDQRLLLLVDDDLLVLGDDGPIVSDL